MHFIHACAANPIPTSIVWMPVGTHDLNAKTLGGAGFSGKIICDAEAAATIAASFNSIKASGQRVWLDLDHDDGAAAGWVTGFSWNPSRGIMASVQWTPRGESALRNKEFFSFSPAFSADRLSGKVSGLLPGHAAGGLVNAPAFAAMPALIAASHADIAEDDETQQLELLKEGIAAGLTLDELHVVKLLHEISTNKSFTKKKYPFN